MTSVTGEGGRNVEQSSRIRGEIPPLLPAPSSAQDLLEIRGRPHCGYYPKASTATTRSPLAQRSGREGR